MLEIVCADDVSEGLSAPTCSTDLAHCAIVEVRKWNSSPCSASRAKGGCAVQGPKHAVC